MLDCAPAFDYGRRPAHWRYTGRGYHQSVAQAEAIELELIRHNFSTRDSTGRAELGLPLQLDSRLVADALGAVHPGLRLGGQGLLLFIADLAERDDELQIVYRRDGERELDEITLDHLNGYEGARPVRVGSAAYRQRQHDVWGAFIESVYLHVRSRDHLDERLWPILKRLVEQALEHWREPDCGMWEVRGEPKHFT